MSAPVPEPTSITRESRPGVGAAATMRRSFCAAQQGCDACCQQWGLSRCSLL